MLKLVIYYLLYINVFALPHIAAISLFINLK